MAPRRAASEVAGFQVSYVVAGEGPALLIVPGVLQSAADWVEAGYVDRLSADWHVLVVDPLGHGESDKPHDPGAYAAEQTIAGLVGILEQEDAAPAVIWGFETGAETVVDLARRRPDVVRAVVVGALFLGDFATILRSLGVDLHSMVEQSATALERGDWELYFDLRMSEIPVDVRESMARTNDPRAIAASLRSDLRRPRGFLKPQAPTFAYWSAGESYAAQNMRLAEQMPIDFGTVPGGRVDGFRRADDVIALVRPFLEEVVRG